MFFRYSPFNIKMSSYPVKYIKIDFNEINEPILKIISQKGKKYMKKFLLLDKDIIKNPWIIKMKKTKKNGKN